MKRDMDLVRKILLAVEEHEHGSAPDITVDGSTKEQIGYHVFLMVEGQLLHGVDVTCIGSRSPEWAATSMTWKGHDFLDASRDDTRWNEAKRLLGKAGSAAFPVVLKILADLTLRQVSQSA